MGRRAVLAFNSSPSPDSVGGLVSEFWFVIREAEAHERRLIEERSGEPLGSDRCLLLRVEDTMVGWWDDYASFHVLPGCPGDHAEVKRLGEALLLAAADLWTACQQ